MQCVRYLSQRTLFKQLRQDPVKVAAVGSGCSLATEPAAEISHFFNIPQVIIYILIFMPQSIMNMSNFI